MKSTGVLTTTEDFTVFKTSNSHSRSTRLSFGLAAGALMLLVSATGVLAGGHTPVSSGSTPPSPGGGGAVRVSPDPSVIDLRRTAYDRVRLSADGKRLVVFFWMGPQECYGLGKVDALYRNGALKIRLWTGTRPNADGVACIEIAQLYKTVIHLKR